MMEVQTVIDYIKIFHEVDGKSYDIGVVSPYKEQCKQIIAECHKNGFENINVATAEEYQGQEKAIMIISTVRSGQETLGFVKDDRVIFHFFHFGFLFVIQLTFYLFTLYLINFRG